MDAIVHEGDCLDVLPTIETASIDAVICDPPYPEIDRAYGRWTEAEWWELMMGVCREVRRVLKPTGSAVFVLQPNSRKVGSMRGWLFDFQSWVCREWNMVQDAYWWNTSTLPLAGAGKEGTLRPSLKACVWAGPEDCYRNQPAVLLTESDNNKRDRVTERFDKGECPSRRRSATEGPRDNHRRLKTACIERGGTTPFNVLPFGSDGRWSGGTDGHSASTPLALMRWWVRYICPPDGLVLDPFAGSGTLGLACLAEGRRAILVERVPEYATICRKRINEAVGPLFANMESPA